MCVDHAPGIADSPAALRFVFDGGVLEPDRAAAVVPDGVEIVEAAWLPPSQAMPLLADGPRCRLGACLAALQAGTTAYLENGRDPWSGDR